jgi:hypothetical protein
LLAQLFELLDALLVGHQGGDQFAVVRVNHPPRLRDGDDEDASEQQQAEHEARYRGHIAWPNVDQALGELHKNPFARFECAIWAPTPTLN